MIALVQRHLALLQKLAIVFLLAWFAFMLLLFWRSGEAETRRALARGERFIIYTADGRVEGATVGQPKEAVIEVPPAVEPVKADASEVTSVQASSSPIVDVSDDLLDKTAGVPLPRISESGIKPWQYYVKTFRRQNELPLIAIVITGLGQSKQATDMALALDDRFSLSFSPYGASVASWAAASRLTGHEMYVDLPVQTSSYPNEDPGPYAVLLSRSNTENTKNLLWAMSRFQGYAGLVIPPNEVVTSNADTYTPIAEEFSKRGVMMLVGHVPQIQHADDEKKATVKGLVSLNADIWIDEELTEMTIQARLATLEQIAQRNGVAIGYARSYPLAISQIKHWHETLGERGIVLAPLSFIAKLKND